MECWNKVKGLYISGRAVRTLVELLGEDKPTAIRIMKFYKITDDQAPDKFSINPDEWYDLDRYLHGLKEIQEKVGEEKVRTVAFTTIQFAPLPSQVRDILSSLGHMDKAYHLNLSRDGIQTMYESVNGKFQEGAGRIITDPIPGINKVVCTSTTCFSTAYESGLISGFAKKFQPNAVVQLDKTKPLKQKGAESNTFIITW
ncbi:MAG: hypothetical protein IPL26_08885 [Leptospiraceae bacterium]|nr:hypothetical protein [Leptospiraceae bacterium]